MFELIKKLFRRKESMVEDISKKELEYIIQNHLISDSLKNMKTSDAYYIGKHDILKRKIYGLSGNNEKTVLENVPNYKIVDNQFQGILNQKVNYIFSKTPSIVSANEKYNEELLKILNQEFFKTLFLLGKNAYKYGIAWLYVYYNNDGELEFKIFDSKEIIPIWKDVEHNELNKVIRLYNIKEFDGKEYKIKTNVEIYTIAGIETYELKNNKLELKEKLKPYITIKDDSYAWDKLFIIPYLNVYGYIGIQGDGDVSTLQVDVNPQNYESLLNLLKKSLYENCKGIDAKSDILKNNPNQMNMQSMYSDIDLDANEIEREFKFSLTNQHIKLKTNKDYENEKLEIVFNRDILINEIQAIDDCIKSMQVLSKETVIAQHPWVSDVGLEIERLKESGQIFENYEELEKNE